MRSPRIWLALSLFTALFVAPAAGQQSSASFVSTRSEGLSDAQVAAIRAATEKYRDVSVALAEGYVEHPVCVDAAMEGAPVQLGAMGYHYFRPDLLGIGATEPRVSGNGTHEDFTQPSILVYEPQADGKLELVAIENLIWAKAWAEAGNTEPPSFAGNQYYYMHDNPETPVDEAHGFEPHWELHWWLYRDNPAGAFAPFNQAASCEHQKSGHAGH